MAISCEFELCIYQKDGTCILSSVEINRLGMCDQAILLDWERGELDIRKAVILQKLEGLDA